MRVLLLADVCNPEWPSLPVVGYKYARAIADHADVTVVTQVRNRPNIDRHGFGRAKVIYVDTEKVAAPVYRLAGRLRGGAQKAWTLQMAMDYPGYLAFEIAAWRHFRPDLEDGQFDIVHRITPMTPTLPSPMAGWSPVPFVLGPLNGNLPWPKSFMGALHREREWLAFARGAYKLLPYYRSTYARPAAVLAAFEHTMADLPRAIAGRVLNFPEVGIDPDLFSSIERPERDKITILFAGRLVPYKMPDVVVAAMARSPVLRRHRLLIAGDGPERARLERMIARHQLSDCVELLGHRPQAEIGALMRAADIFAFPSIRELGAGVVVEAMACAMTCVVVDYGGPATLIDSDRGVKVPLGTRIDLVHGFTRALESLVQDREHQRRLGQQAAQHALTYYTWDAKARKTVQTYQWALRQRTVKPDFWDASPDLGYTRPD